MPHFEALVNEAASRFRFETNVELSPAAKNVLLAWVRLHLKRVSKDLKAGKLTEHKIINMALSQMKVGLRVRQTMGTKLESEAENFVSSHGDRFFGIFEVPISQSRFQDPMAAAMAIGLKETCHYAPFPPKTCNREEEEEADEAELAATAEAADVDEDSDEDKRSREQRADY
jgi:hypothetical protein